MTLVVLAGLSSASVACGSSGGTDKVAGGSTTKTDDVSSASTCDPNDPKIPCFKDKAEPCGDSFKTDFPGDDLCLKPPKDGFQLHVGPGPDDYDNPDAVQKWILPAGGFPGQGPDTNWCYYMKTPNTTPIYTAEYYAHMRPGSHHYIMFGVNADVADSTGPDSCAQRDAQVAGGANFLSGATREVQNAAMFGDAPEDQGLGSPIDANAQLNMNLHFVNISDAPVLEEIWVNMIEKPADEVTNIVKAIEWYGGLTMQIPPHENQTLQSPAAGCAPPSDIPTTRILGVTAHMHANTVRVSMYHQAPGVADADKELVFDDFDWSEPTVWLFNSKLTNPMPDRDSAKSGAPISGVFNVTPQDKFSWECQVENKTDTTLTFSDKAYTGEMCNVFGMYASPVASKPWSCFF
ncbi:MAG TPA: hypothetical protein VH062_35815 [Polyangiaceae bacterium]|jgi:hypothetical protein|nr:hypothetical protein [Polyangiaceae bacterium]